VSSTQTPRSKQRPTPPIISSLSRSRVTPLCRRPPNRVEPEYNPEFAKSIPINRTIILWFLVLRL
jgi:hypothetical protein